MKKNVKKSIMKNRVVCGLLTGMFIALSTPVWAGCRDYNYDELKDMSSKELLKVYCEELFTTRDVMMAAIYNSRYDRERDSCFAVCEKIERVYNRKVKDKLTHEQIMGICDKK